MVKKVWGECCEAEKHSAWSKRNNGLKLENIGDDDLIIWVKPGETILGHTQEYIGGRKKVTTMMKARSSMGRNFIEVCKVHSNHRIDLRNLTLDSIVCRMGRYRLHQSLDDGNYQ